jgi:hypothetical protein
MDEIILQAQTELDRELITVDQASQARNAFLDLMHALLARIPKGEPARRHARCALQHADNGDYGAARAALKRAAAENVP